MTPKMEFFNISQQGDILLVDVQREVGSLADHQLPRETQAILDRLGTNGARHVLIDFERIPYFGSVMLETLLAIWNRTREAGGQFVLCNVSDVGREVLDVAKFTTIWPIFESRQAACEHLEKAVA